MHITIKETFELIESDVLEIYQANNWSSAQKPVALIQALLNSHSLVTAWHNDKLIGLGNAISDGYLVVYYPHLIIHPDYQHKGIGTRILETLQQKYKDFHQQILVADANAIKFYKKHDFSKAGETSSMWIYKGDDH